VGTLWRKSAAARPYSECLKFRKATLREWREEFASHLRRVAAEAHAMPRFARGKTRPRKSDAVYRDARRGASTHMSHRLGAAATAVLQVDRTENIARLRVRDTRRALERGWFADGEDGAGLARGGAA
jgi:hypothetical protein